MKNGDQKGRSRKNTAHTGGAAYPRNRTSRIPRMMRGAEQTDGRGGPPQPRPDHPDDGKS